ncbi:hypothetical protein FOXB_15487 [Fusarium oxysporum f. sp. conglutinans Fo5176]|uniref:HTH CENPB-type domain-containing protein n=1 Tax=Fusarium oxysporum (strain Fo5176) TaxID=660025 RepID=F9GA05_FUSOF|nr:hypothetical protein FOXB_15487 [Fusarium oxysporum f. sp. conglutinans Fo5176]
MARTTDPDVPAHRGVPLANDHKMVADGVSVNKAAEACGINRSTLQGRVKGSTTPREAQKSRQKLSDVQEKRLRDWIIVQADLGCPVSHQQVREFARLFKSKYRY